MLKIQRSSNGQVVFTLTGQMDEEHIAEFKALINAETGGSRIVLGLKNLIMVGRDTVDCLAPLRSRWRHPGELRGVCPRVDHETTRGYLTF
jgi:anti-anti-sigma regulatory factor